MQEIHVNVLDLSEKTVIETLLLLKSDGTSVDAMKPPAAEARSMFSAAESEDKLLDIERKSMR